MSTNPNSAFTRFRRWLAIVIEPRPDPGELWCIDCSQNNGRTLILGADSMRAHLETHNDYIRIAAAWPPRKKKNEESK
jgi:hypothetical protein